MAEAPRVVGRYVVHAEIASGGMATVHVGRLLGPVGFARTVAIKRLHPHFAKDPDFVAMFLDEARLASRVRHPNVVPVLDVVSEGAELFLVMDYVEGESLSRLIAAASREGRAPPAHIAGAIVAQALHGLHAAHETLDERGEPLAIVHRDVSPHNVLVGTDGTARVVDFGVAKAVGRASFTREGELKGKLPYMAPEQVRRGGEVTRRTDVYSAGVVLWEALTAARLFHGDGEGEILSAVIEGAREPPSSVESTVPPALDAITMRALARDPGDRFPDAREMALAIEDAIGIVPPAEIGAWAAQMGRDAIAARARAVAEVETSPGIATANATPLLEETATFPSMPAIDPTDYEETTAMPVVEDEPEEPKTTAMPPKKKPRRWPLLLLLLFPVVPLLILLARTGDPEPARPEPSPTPEPVLLAPSASATATVSAEPSVSAVAPAPSVEDLPPITFPSASTKKPPPHKSPWAKSTCQPPYYYENGIKKFKANCL